jgi:hypothetical protein
MTRKGIIVFVILILCASIYNLGLYAQVDDDFEDFDISQFEVASTTLKSYCTNKISGQSPTQLISFSFDAQGSSTLSLPDFEWGQAQDVNWDYSPGFRFNSNIPVISKNNILINWSFNYVQLGYVKSSGQELKHPLAYNLDQNSLKWLNNNFTIFKPLNDKKFLLFQVGAELNGDYDFNNLPELKNTRFIGTAIYGIKPSDDLMLGFGLSRTYIGGALNYLPILYYYQTFKNEKWGIEAVLPARAQLRYRSNSRNVFLLGWQMEGGSYTMSNFNSFNNSQVIPGPSPGNGVGGDYDLQLRRSEIRAGLSYMHGLNDFIWIGASAGYRINWSFDLDDGDFFRGFDSEGYLMETQLSNTPFVQLTLSLVSP